MTDTKPAVPPPNGATRLSRRLLMFGATFLLLGWVAAWIFGVTDREPPLTMMVFLASLSMLSTSSGDELSKSLLQVIIKRLGA